MFEKVGRSHIIIQGPKPRHIFGMDSVDFERSTKNPAWKITCRFSGFIPKSAFAKAMKEGNLIVEAIISDTEHNAKVFIHSVVMQNCKSIGGYMGKIVTTVSIAADSIEIFSNDDREKVLLT